MILWHSQDNALNLADLFSFNLWTIWLDGIFLRHSLSQNFIMFIHLKSTLPLKILASSLLSTQLCWKRFQWCFKLLQMFAYSWDLICFKKSLMYDKVLIISIFMGAVPSSSKSTDADVDTDANTDGRFNLAFIHSPISKT